MQIDFLFSFSLLLHCDCWMRSICLLFFVWRFHRKYMQNVCERLHVNKLVVASEPPPLQKPGVCERCCVVLAPLTWHWPDTLTQYQDDSFACIQEDYTPFLTTCFDLDVKFVILFVKHVCETTVMLHHCICYTNTHTHTQGKKKSPLSDTRAHVHLSVKAHGEHSDPRRAWIFVYIAGG